MHAHGSADWTQNERRSLTMSTRWPEAEAWADARCGVALLRAGGWISELPHHVPGPCCCYCRQLEKSLGIAVVPSSPPPFRDLPGSLSGRGKRARGPRRDPGRPESQRW